MNWIYECLDDCAHTLGAAPHRTRIGMAQGDEGPGAVIWVEVGRENQWRDPICIPSRYAHYVADEAMMAALCDQDWLDKYLRGEIKYSEAG